MYRVYYKNEGRAEKSPMFNTEKEARECAEFLKFQGATSIRVKKGGHVMNLNEIKQLIDENLPDDLNQFTPGDIDKELLDSMQFVLEEIRFQVDRAVIQNQKQFLMN